LNNLSGQMAKGAFADRNIRTLSNSALNLEEKMKDLEIWRRR